MLKPKTDPLDKSGIVYGYNCLCDAKYVGESKRKFLSRIQEHNQKSRATAVYNHIQSCESFKNSYPDKFGKLPTFQRSKKESNNRLSILKDRFTIIGSNLGNYYRRTDYEGIYITINKPVLNDQVKHRNVKLI